MLDLKKNLPWSIIAIRRLFLITREKVSLGKKEKRVAVIHVEDTWGNIFWESWTNALLNVKGF